MPSLIPPLELGEQVVSLGQEAETSREQWWWLSHAVGE